MTVACREGLRAQEGVHPELRQHHPEEASPEAFQEVRCQQQPATGTEQQLHISSAKYVNRVDAHAKLSLHVPHWEVSLPRERKKEVGIDSYEGGKESSQYTVMVSGISEERQGWKALFSLLID